MSESITLELACLTCEQTQEIHLPQYRHSFFYICSRCGREIEVSGLPNKPQVRLIANGWKINHGFKTREEILDETGMPTAMIYHTV